MTVVTLLYVIKYNAFRRPDEHGLVFERKSPNRFL